MHKFVSLANSMLKDNYTGFIQQPGDDFDPWGFGVSRAHELSSSLQWLYEVHPDGQEAVIWETMELMWSGAVVGGKDWTTFFVEGVFPLLGTPPEKVIGGFEHGVNMAQGKQSRLGTGEREVQALTNLNLGLRYMAHLYRMNKNESLIQQTRDAVNWTYTYQGSASGTITADEYIGGNSPQRG